MFGHISSPLLKTTTTKYNYKKEGSIVLKKKKKTPPDFNGRAHTREKEIPAYTHFDTPTLMMHVMELRVLLVTPLQRIPG